jgi:hypothetical protein
MLISKPESFAGGALVDVRDLAQVTAHMHRSRVCARLRERRANIVFNVIDAPAEVEKRAISDQKRFRNELQVDS